MGKILVTGANGFIGSHICEAFIKAGFSVRAFVRKSSDLTNIKSLDMRTVYGDLDNTDSLKDAVSGIDIIVNSAGLTKALDTEEFERVNIGGTENILGAIESVNPGIERFIQISSAAASGPSDCVAVKNDSNSCHSGVTVTVRCRPRLPHGSWFMRQSTVTLSRRLARSRTFRT